MSSGHPPDFDVESLWRDLRGPLLTFIARRVRDRDTAEDILQDVVLRIHLHASDLTLESSVSGWMHQIARNAIIDHYRRAVVRRERSAGATAELDRPAPSESGPDSDAVRKEVAACLVPLLSQLPDKYREALELTDLQGMTQADAATRIGLTLSGMKTRVQRGRAQLKTLLTQCCEIELDRRKGVISYHPLPTGGCGCQPGR